jgi:hypothetical protein
LACALLNKTTGATTQERAMRDKKADQKLSLNKETIRGLKIKTNLKAGDWSDPSNCYSYMIVCTSKTKTLPP